MKKIFLKNSILIIALLLISVTTNFSLAQEKNLFDTSSVVREEKIKPNTNSELAIGLYPFTTIFIEPGSFKEDVTFTLYKDNFENIKNLLSNGQSPISSYYFSFKSSTGESLLPSVPLRIQSYNNFTNTETYFYPLKSITEIDSGNQKKVPGNIKITTDLPVNDTGFIVATNKNLSSNDSALHPTTVPNSNLDNIEPNSNNEKTQNNPKNLSFQAILFPLFIFLVLAAILFVLFNLLKKKRSKNA